MFQVNARQNFPSVLCPTAIFSLTDSLSDTGNRNLEALASGNTSPSGSFPYGMTIGKPTGRYSDGYLLIDFLTRGLKLGDSARPSLTYNGTYFTSLNFGYAGATVCPSNNNFSTPHILSAQVSDFLWHKQQVKDYQDGAKVDKNVLYEKALYFIEIGGNDINYMMPRFSDILNTTIPSVISGIKSSILSLYESGARNFLVLNLPRSDCAPGYMSAFTEFADIFNTHTDQFGCIVEVTQVFETFNKQLLDMVIDINYQNDDINIYHFDWFAATDHVIKNMHHYKFKSYKSACCGIPGNDYHCEGLALCGCGQTNGTTCKNPGEHVTWDGTHYTQHFYEVSSQFVLHGNFISPRLNLLPGCGIPMPPSEN
ncbi:hypothetical protein SELMODRAFT_115333 [Selaginella moellendorffii]|uniref:SGNH hydrolase-type esterase domain-containing protein n=1 Tax=Selaginella moellendorffii TaxID=88036 RepID=D8SF64_SELML|nr:hypothetical protein SELMODRAFT_115333 [Selaginella moellendorffii]